MPGAHVVGWHHSKVWRQARTAYWNRWNIYWCIDAGGVNQLGLDYICAGV